MEYFCPGGCSMTVDSALFKEAMVRALLREIDHPGTGKTMTRRIITPRNFKLRGHDFDFHRPDSASLASAFKGARDFRWIEGAFSWIADPDEMHPLAIFVDCRGVPKYAPGDHLWVRESHQFRGADYGDSDGEIEWFRCYGSGGAADNWDPVFPHGWKPSIHDSPRLLSEPGEQEGDGIRGYVTKHRPSIHMPRWASRLTLIVSDVRIERLQDITEADAIAEGVERMRSGRGYYDPTHEHGAVHAGIWFDTAVEAFAELWNSINGPGAWEANPWVTVTSFTPHLQNIDLMVAT